MVAKKKTVSKKKSVAPKSAPKKKGVAKKTTPAKKAVAKKSAPAKKTVAKKADAPVTKNASTRYGNETNAMGFVPGSDSAIIAAALVEGGENRMDCAAKAEAEIEKVNGLTTRNGTKKNVISLTTSVQRMMVERGFEVQSTYKVVPPENLKAAIQAEKRKSSRKKK